MAFTGKALYDNLTAYAEDVGDLVEVNAVWMSPVLNALGTNGRRATSVYHEWLEDRIIFETVISSTAITSIAAGGTSYFQPSFSGLQMQVGDVIRNGAEYMQVSAVTANSIAVTRGFGSSSTTSLAAGGTIQLVSNAALEGFDVTVDVSTARSRKNNYVQIIQKPIIVSGSAQAMGTVGGIGDEVSYQKNKRVQDCLRDLERAVTMGISTSTTGSSTVYRTMKGLWNFITTVNSAVVANSFTASPDTYLNATIRSAWDNGGRDLDLVIAGPTFKNTLSTLNSSRVQTTNTEGTYRNLVTYYESDFGRLEIVMTPFLPSSSLLVVNKSRCKVTPFRSFGYGEVAKTGDSYKGMVMGEYTMEVHHEETMAKLYV